MATFYNDSFDEDTYNKYLMFYVKHKDVSDLAQYLCKKAGIRNEYQRESVSEHMTYAFLGALDDIFEYVEPDEPLTSVEAVWNMVGEQVEEEFTDGVICNSDWASNELECALMDYPCDELAYAATAVLLATGVYCVEPEEDDDEDDDEVSYSVKRRSATTMSRSGARSGKRPTRR